MRGLKFIPKLFNKTSKFNKKIVFFGISASIPLFYCLHNKKIFYKVNAESIKSSDFETPILNDTETFKTIFKTGSIEKLVPHEVQYVIIGGGIAGLSAAKSIRASDPLSKILIIDCNSSHDSLSIDSISKGLPYSNMMLKEIMRLLYLQPETNYIKPNELNQCKFGGVSILKGHEVTELNPDDYTIQIKGIEHKIKYQACLLATGSKEIRLESLEKTQNTQENILKTKEVQYCPDLYSFKNIISELKKEYKSVKHPKKVLIIGDGLSATELSCNIATYMKPLTGSSSSIEIIQICTGDYPMNDLLPNVLSKDIKSRMEQMGIKLLTNTSIERIDRKLLWEDGGKRKKKLKITNKIKNKINILDDIDLIIISAGKEPNTNLSKSANLELTNDITKYGRVVGGYLAKSELEIRDGLFVAGSAGTFYDSILNQRRHSNDWRHAEEMGHVAGTNMAAYVMSQAIRDNTYGRHLTDDSDKDIVSWQQIIRPDLLASDVLEVKLFEHQPEFSFNITGRFAVAVGDINSKYKMRTILAKPSINQSESEVPGLVLYMSNENQIMGILLWNCANRLLTDRDGDPIGPKRMNVARDLIRQKKRLYDLNDADLLKDVVPLFDLAGSLNEELQKQIMQNSVEENVNVEIETEPILAV